MNSSEDDKELVEEAVRLRPIRCRLVDTIEAVKVMRAASLEGIEALSIRAAHRDGRWVECVVPFSPPHYLPGRCWKDVRLVSWYGTLALAAYGPRNVPFGRDAYYKVKDVVVRLKEVLEAPCLDCKEDALCPTCVFCEAAEKRRAQNPSLRLSEWPFNAA